MIHVPAAAGKNIKNVTGHDSEPSRPHHPFVVIGCHTLRSPLHLD